MHVLKSSLNLTTPKILFFVLLMFIYPISVSGLRQDIKSLYDRNVRYYNQDCLIDPSIKPGGAGATFMIGDSIGQGLIAAEFEARLKENNMAPLTADLTQGISLNTVIQDRKLDSTENQTAVKNAQTIIIELGTNPSGAGEEFRGQVSAFIDSVKAINPGAKIFWVGIGSTKFIDIYNEYNGILAEISPQKNFQFIDWRSQNIPLESDGVHPTAQGKQTLATFLATTIGGAGAVSAVAATPSGNCACSQGTLLPGKDNREKIWNYFTTKGLQPFQIAGFMGNLQAESGFNPKRVQSTPTPEGDRDEITVDGKTGYGLAQWTPVSRQQGLVDFAQKAGKPTGDLGVQLDYLWYEITEANLRGLADELRATANLEEATRLILYKFENPQVKDLTGRMALAEPILAELGSGAPSSGAVGASGGGCGSPGVCSSSSNLPIPKEVSPAWFNTDAHNNSISWPGGEARHRPILSKNNAQGIESVANSDYPLGEATDVGMSPGTPVYAPFEGTVKLSSLISNDKPGNGFMVIIESMDKKCIAVLAHLTNVAVSANNTVTSGQQIADIIAMGEDHLHFELWVDAQPINIGAVEINTGFSEKAEEIWEKQKTALGQGG